MTGHDAPSDTAGAVPTCDPAPRRGNRHPRLVVAGLATLVLGAAGVAHPVVAEAARLITGADVRNNSLTGRDIADGTLKSRDFAPGQLTSGAVGPAGSTGPAGPAGPGGPAGADGSAAPRPTYSTWTVRHSGDGQPGARGTSSATVPAFSQVSAVDLDISDLSASCPGYWTVDVHDEGVTASLANRFGDASSATVLGTLLVGDSPRRLGWSVDCLDLDLQPAAVPAFELTVVFAVTTGDPAGATTFE